jgi:hypothetical protein
VTWAILIASVIAAVGAVAAILTFALGEVRRRPRLELEFTGAWTRSGAGLHLGLRMRAGEAAISRIDIYPMVFVPGLVVTPSTALGPFRLEPRAHNDVSVIFGTPSPIAEPRGGPLEIVAPIGAIAVYGRKTALAVHPEGPSPPRKLVRNVRRALVRDLPASVPTS